MLKLFRKYERTLFLIIFAPAIIGLGVMTLLLVASGPVGRRPWERWLVPGAVLLASMVHPAGARALSDYVAHLATGGLYRQMVQEWQPLLSATQRQLPERTATIAMAMLTLVGTLAALRQPRSRERWGLVVLLLGLATSPFLAVRQRDLLAIGALPAFALLVGPVPSPPARRRPWIRTGGILVAVASLFLLVAGGGGYAPAWPPRPHLDTTGFPIDATDFLRRDGPPSGGRVVNSYDFGGWMVHELGPEWRIFVDGRYFVYGEAVVEEYLSLRDAAPGTRERLALREAEWLFLRYPAADGYQALAGVARTWPEWALVHWDDQALVYARRDRVDAAWLVRHEYRTVDPTQTVMPDDVDWWRDHHREIVVESWRAQGAAPRSARPWLVLGLAFERAGRDGEAAMAYGRVTRLFPGHRIAREALARIRARHAGQWPPAVHDDQLRNEYGLAP